MSVITYTTLTPELCPGIEALIKVAFPQMPASDQYDLDDLLEMADLFPEGTPVALDGSQVVGFGTGILIDIDFDNLPATEHDLLFDDEQDLSRHNPAGAYYYGSDLAVLPAYRGRGIARQIYDRRKALVVEQGKQGFVAAAVLPGYREYKQALDIDTYLAKVVAGEHFDPTLSVQLRNGFKVMRPLKDFFTYPRSDNWSALIMWQPER